MIPYLLCFLLSRLVFNLFCVYFLTYYVPMSSKAVNFVLQKNKFVLMRRQKKVMIGHKPILFLRAHTQNIYMFFLSLSVMYN